MIIVREKKGNDRSWEIHYEHTDAQEISRELDCPVFIADELCRYLEEKEDLLRVSACYDSQSGWIGKHIFVGGKDLSGNGYCYKMENLIEFLEDHEKFEERTNLVYAKAIVTVVVDVSIGEDFTPADDTNNMLCTSVLKELEMPNNKNGYVDEVKVTNVSIVQKR